MLKTITVFNTHPYPSDKKKADNAPPSELGLFLRWVEDVLQSIPQEHREDAVISFAAREEYDMPYVQTVVYYTREETREEEETRKLDLKKRKEQAEIMERAELERLKKKYGG